MTLYVCDPIGAGIFIIHFVYTVASSSLYLCVKFKASEAVVIFWKV